MNQTPARLRGKLRAKRLASVVGKHSSLPLLLDAPAVKFGVFKLQPEDERYPPVPRDLGPKRRRDIYFGSLRSSAVAIMMTRQFKLGHTRAFLRRNGMLFLEHVGQPL